MKSPGANVRLRRRDWHDTDACEFLHSDHAGRVQEAKGGASICLAKLRSTAFIRYVRKASLSGKLLTMHDNNTVFNIK
jgi:hypothetical protein